MSSSSEREALSRIMSVLINHKAVLCVTSGETLRRILEWCANDAILDIVRGTPLPQFTQLQVISDATEESLELYAAKINAYLINVLPSAYRQRLLARYAVESSPSMLDFPSGVSDRDAFLETATIAYSMLEKPGGE
ncbi:hypothetical protein [Brucella intermedia]|uniref:hypothetical protein n=1 Tax=Brucella intermedia TaxID=94625 RepID=UPI00235E4179|nr:hypothetical protein [Brucella intermedia]